MTATALAAVLGLAACGTSAGDDAAPPKQTGKTTTTVEATTSTEAPTTTVAGGLDPNGDIPVVDHGDGPDDPTDDPTDDPIEPSDEPVDILNRLEHVNLAIDDLPDGWTSSPSDQQETSVVQECATNGGEEDLLYKTRSDSFELSDADAGGALGIDSGSGWMADEGVADDLMDELKTDDFAVCAGEKLLSGDETVTVEGDFQQVELDAELGEDRAALQGDFTISDSEQTIHVSAIVVFMRTGQVVSNVIATAIEVPGDEQLLYSLLDLVSQRQAEAA